MTARLFATMASVLLSVALLAAPQDARANTCDQMRADIVIMERDSVKPPGYSLLRTKLLHQALICRDRASANEYWYRVDGTPTGALASADRPDDAAYAATPEVGAACAPAANPSVCALDAQVAASCRTPQPESRWICGLLFGNDYESTDRSWRGLNRPLPPTTVTLDGLVYTVDPRCAEVLLNASRGPLWLNALRSMRNSCPQLLKALEQRTGLDAGRDPGFWPALDELVIGNFPPRGTPPMTAAAINANQDFRLMCKQAADNEKTCRARQGRMGEVGTVSKSRALQAGDFGDCADLYGAVAEMCTHTAAAAARAPVFTPAAPAPNTAAALPPAVPRARSGDGASAPPPDLARPAPPALQSMSPHCKEQLNALLEGADRRDNAKAQSAYESLRGGNCDAGLRGLTQEANLDWPERKTGEISKEAFRRCIIDPSNCGTAPSAAGGESLRGGGFEIGEVLDFANSFMGLLSGVAGVYSAMPGGAFVNSGGGSNMGTINGRARSTYGQGAPVHTAPRQTQSTITGTR